MSAPTVRTMRETLRQAADWIDPDGTSQWRDQRKLAAALRTLATRIDEEEARAKKWRELYESMWTGWCTQMLARLDAPVSAQAEPRCESPLHCGKWLAEWPEGTIPATRAVLFDETERRSRCYCTPACRPLHPMCKMCRGTRKIFTGYGDEDSRPCPDCTGPTPVKGPR